MTKQNSENMFGKLLLAFSIMSADKMMVLAQPGYGSFGGGGGSGSFGGYGGYAPNTGGANPYSGIDNLSLEDM